jgi:MYXO-CTERM domain-containing protein
MNKLFRTLVLILGLTVLPSALSASAQTSPEPSETRNRAHVQTTGEERRDRDWGWIGLLGLAGLAGLMRRREEPAHRRVSEPMPSR